MSVILPCLVPYFWGHNSRAERHLEEHVTQPPAPSWYPMPLLSLLQLTDEKKGPERLGDLSKVTQPVSDWARGTQFGVPCADPSFFFIWAWPVTRSGQVLSSSPIPLHSQPPSQPRPVWSNSTPKRLLLPVPLPFNLPGKHQHIPLNNPFQLTSQLRNPSLASPKKTKQNRIKKKKQTG